MKRCRLFKSILLTASLLFAPFTLLAQSGVKSTSIDEVKQLIAHRTKPVLLKKGLRVEDQQTNLVPLVKGFGYASVEPTLTHKPMEFEEEAEGIMTPFLVIPPIGDFSVKGVECVVAEPVTDARIIVAKVQLDGMGELWQEVVVSQACSLEKGYNKIMLDEAQHFTEKDLVLVGYSVHASGKGGDRKSPVLYDGDTYCLPEANMVAVSESFYEKGKAYGFSQVQHTETFNLGSALVYALLDDPNGLFDYLVYPLKQPHNSILRTNEYFSYKLSLRNIGFKDIEGMTFYEKCYYGYDLREKLYPFEMNIPVKGLCDAGWAHPPYPLGTSKGTVELDQINGTPVRDKGMIRWVFDSFIPTEKGSKERKSVLVEYYTSEAAPNAPQYNEKINIMAGNLIANGYDVSLVAYPVGSDDVAFAEEACNETLAMLLGRPTIPTPTALPYFAINRAPYLADKGELAFVSKKKLFDDGGIEDPYILDPFLHERERAIITEAVCKDLPGGMTSLEVKGKLLLDADPDDLYITAVLTEDYIKAKDQKGVEMGKNYEHMNLVRTFYTSNRGTKFTPEADGSFVFKSPEIDIYPSWKKENLKAVIILHRNPMYESRISSHAYCSKTLFYGTDFTSNKETTSPEKKVSFFQDATGLLQIDGTYKSLEVFSIDGQRVTQALPAQLAPGSYIVVVRQNQNATCHKVIIK